MGEITIRQPQVLAVDALDTNRFTVFSLIVANAPDVAAEIASAWPYHSSDFHFPVRA
jgi:hypothetical protein